MTDTPGFVLRAIRVDDAAGLAELHGQPRFRWGTLRPRYPSVDAVRKWLETRPPEDTHIVAESAGRIIGDAVLSPGKGRRAHTATIGMGVHDDFAGRGIGTELLAALIDIADNWLNLKRLELTVWTDNAPAQALYRKSGFVEEGVMRAYAYRDGAYVDALAMARLRGSGRERCEGEGNLMGSDRKPPTWRVVIAYILDAFTVFFGFGYLIGWLTGGLTSNGFAINGFPALVLFLLIIAYFIICHRYLRGTLWRHILRVPRPVTEP